MRSDRCKDSPLQVDADAPAVDPGFGQTVPDEVDVLIVGSGPAGAYDAVRATARWSSASGCGSSVAWPNVLATTS